MMILDSGKTVIGDYDWHKGNWKEQSQTGFADKSLKMMKMKNGKRSPLLL